MAFRVQALVLLAFLATGVTASAARVRGGRSHCIVPNVKRDKLGVAEKRLRAAHCSAGRIRGPHNGLVTGQSPRPGRHNRTGARVALTLRSRSSASKVLARTPQPVGVPGNWKLVLNAGFTGRSLDTSLWRSGWFGSNTASAMNATQEDCYSPDNITFPGDGTMHLNVTAQPSSCGGVTQPYTGALVNTDPLDGRPRGGFQYTYGVLEARVYLPGVGGQIADWPGVWADGQSWPADGEDDLMEGLKGVPCSTYHSPLGVTRACDKDILPGWHTFASDWEPGSVTYYYDGVPIGTVTTGVAMAPEFIVLDNTVHTGEANVTAAASMQVQYVRVWQSQN